jgi:hypothetical protein
LPAQANYGAEQESYARGHRISVMVGRTPGEVSVSVIEREGDIQVVTTA